MQCQFFIGEFQISSFAIEHRELPAIDDDIKSAPDDFRPFRFMKISEMICHFNIETDDDQNAQPENVLYDKARKVKQIKDAGDEEFSEGKLCLHDIQ